MRVSKRTTPLPSSTGSASLSSFSSRVTRRWSAVSMPPSSLARQLRDMLVERRDLIDGRARIRLVAEQEVEHGRKLRRGLIARAIRHRAVRELEQQLELTAALRVAAHGKLLDHLDHRARALEAAAHVEEPPAVAVRHVLGNHAVEGGQILNEPIQETQRIVGLVPRRQLPRLADFGEVAQDAERVERQPLAHGFGVALHVAEHGREPVLALGIEQDRPELPLHGLAPFLHRRAGRGASTECFCAISIATTRSGDTSVRVEPISPPKRITRLRSKRTAPSARSV